jgi:hypothetical protein
VTPEVSRICDALRLRGCRPRSSGDGLKALCPACQMDGGKHEPALAVKRGDKQALVMHCHGPGACDDAAVLTALDLTWSELSGNGNTSRQNSTNRTWKGEGAPKEVERWTYVDEGGRALFDVVRLEPGEDGKPKTFRQHLPGATSGGIGETRRVLYRLPDVVVAARDGCTIYVVEGERCADAVNACPDVDRLIATTSPGGAKAFRDEYADALRGAARVVIWRDRDSPGRRYARDIAAALDKRGVPYAIVESPHAHDAADHLAAGHDLRDVLEVEIAGEDDDQDGDTGPAKGPLPEGILVGMSAVVAQMPAYDAGSFVRRKGLHLLWGPPGVMKTYLLVRMVLDMTQRRAGSLLLGTFTILRPWKKVLWIGDEESPGEWKARAEIVARGAGLNPPGDEVLFADASGIVLLTTDHVPQLLEMAGGCDAVVLDPLANLLPGEDHEGRAVRVDADNTHALRRVLRPLRRLCKQQDMAVFLLHHPGASGERERGPTAYRGSADIVVEVRSDSGLLVLIDHKNRDRAKGRLVLRPDWTQGDGGAYTLGLEPADLPPESRARGLVGTAAKMYAAAQAGAGKITKADLFGASYPTKGQADVSRRTKERAWAQLVAEKLVADIDVGVVQLVSSLEPKD